MEKSDGYMITKKERELEKIVDKIKATESTLECIIILERELNKLLLACVIKGEADSVCKMCNSDNTEIVTYQICKNCGL